jgi:alginate O-acetyltransferase complex protein AlgI
MLCLLAASIIFYAFWSPWYLLVIFASTSVDYMVALKMAALQAQRLRKILLWLSLSVNLGLLAFFKYGNFLTINFLNLVGSERAAPVFHVVLPLGISFYTFEAISYVVDVYRRRIEPVRNPADYALFILFFPHLIAGPIVRPGFFFPQVRRQKRFDWIRIQLGCELFLRGLFKKAVIADHLAAAVDPVFADPASFASRAIWWAVVCYTVQIYCDFSGYSDMAIGLAHSFGFKLPVNFRMPYLSLDISEFWRRWHITLSSWLRDYLYFPLGGSREGRLKTYRNLLLTMTLGGLWHGAGWTFVFWGFYHGTLLSINRALRGRVGLPRMLAGLLTLLAVSVGWVFFRADSFSTALTVLTRMFVPADGRIQDGMLLIGAASLILIVCVGHAIGAGIFGKFIRLGRILPAPAWGVAMATTFVIAQLLMPDDGKLFIYFQF